jgi:hypothetical protein
MIPCSAPVAFSRSQQSATSRGGVLALLLLIVLFAGGCSSTAVTHRTAADREMLTVSRTVHGYTMGPCGFAKGSTYSLGTLQLDGRKDRYVDGEFSVVSTPPMLTGRFLPRYAGTISVDWKRRKVTVDLQEWSDIAPARHPSRLNGSYSFKEADTATPAS